MKIKISDVFKINEKLLNKEENKRVFLEGFTDLSKRVLLFLAKNGIRVDGFLSDDKTLSEGEFEYLGRKILGQEKIKEDDIIIDVNKNFVEKIFRTKLLECCIRDIPIVIYGAGMFGESVLELFQLADVKVACFADRNVEKKKTMHHGLEVILPSEIKEKYPNAFVVIALGNGIANEVAEELVKQGYISNYSIYDYRWMPENLAIKNGSNVQDEVRLVYDESDDIQLAPRMIYYFYNYRNSKKIIFKGKNASALRELVFALKQLDVKIEYCISDDEYIGFIAETEFKSKYDLMYEDSNNVIVWVADGIANTIKMINEFGMDDKNILYTAYEPLRIKRSVLHLDPSLGYNHPYSIEILTGRGNEKKKKIGILGGSTSEILARYEKAWPEILMDIAEEEGISLECYCGAVGGYTVSQELVKLIRDMLYYKPDIIISYSRINEYDATVQESKFIQLYQKQIFEIMSKHAGNKGITYGEGQYNYAEHWYNQEKIMYAICKEYGIKFYAVMQPCIYEKNPYSKNEMEMDLHIGNKMGNVDYGQEQVVMSGIREYIREKMMESDWIYDFTKIFDGQDKRVYYDNCHVFEHANRIVASKMYEMIKNELTE